MKSHEPFLPKGKVGTDDLQSSRKREDTSPAVSYILSSSKSIPESTGEETV